MNKAPKDYFNELFDTAKTDKNIVGMFLGGSRGKGFETKNSDYDIRLIIKDEFAPRYKKEYKKDFAPGIDMAVMSLSEFEKYAQWGSDTAWDRYEFVRAKALVDKTGNIQKIIDEKGIIPDGEKEKYAASRLDAYLNAFIRSIESYNKGEIVGARLETAISLPYLLDVIFALEDRIAPFVDCLERELSAFPLRKFPLAKNKFSEMIIRILDGNDPAVQQELAKL